MSQGLSLTKDEKSGRKYELESFFGTIADSMLGNYRDFVKGALKNYFISRQVLAEFQL